jgi:hypothetical protein
MQNISSLSYVEQFKNFALQNVDRIQNDEDFRNRLVGTINGIVSGALLIGIVQGDPTLSLQLMGDFAAHAPVWLRGQFGERLTHQQRIALDIACIGGNFFRTLAIGATFWSSKIPPAGNAGDALLHLSNLWYSFTELNHDVQQLQDQAQAKEKKSS